MVKVINRTILILSIVSLFADIASEMLYPVIPVYLKEIGFSVLLIGILEGVAGFTAAFTKGYFGRLSDQKGYRLPFVKAGYLLSAISKPMMAAFAIPLWIFFARTIDRLGKGLRTAARDALLSENATIQTKGEVFGFHRSMDTLGAAIGPTIALLFLLFFPGEYVMLFLLAFIPGAISVFLLFYIKENRTSPTDSKKGTFFSYLSYWNIAGQQYKKLVSGLLLFALVNSSDVFLLLKTKEITNSDTITIGVYIFYNLVFALAAYPIGRLADKLGLKNVLISGLFLFALVYLLFGIANNVTIIIVAFFLYGSYAAATEGISKAWVTNIAHNENTATAVGFFTSLESIGTLLASIIAGAAWQLFGSSVTFFIASIGSTLVLFYFIIVFKSKAIVAE
ncbi:MAG TPA: MFS transporter [Flavisolibacter sp.]|nr:MFS transporter [Flavisolibacter sp.]